MSKLFGTLSDAMPRAFRQDYLSHDGAHLLAARINAYWLRNGQASNAYVVQENLPRGTIPLYNVRSRMIGGQP